MGYVGAYMPVAARHHLRQAAIVVGCNKRQAIKLPRNPDGLALCPFLHIANLLGLGERKGGKLMGFFLPFHHLL